MLISVEGILIKVEGLDEISLEVVCKSIVERVYDDLELEEGDTYMDYILPETTGYIVHNNTLYKISYMEEEPIEEYSNMEFEGNEIEFSAIYDNEDSTLGEVIAQSFIEHIDL